MAKVKKEIFKKKSDKIDSNSYAQNNSSKYIHKKDHVFLTLIPPVFSLKLVNILSPITGFFSNLNPALEKDLKATDNKYTPKEYLTIGFVSYVLLGFILGYLIYLLSIKKERPLNSAILAGFGIFLLVCFLFTYLLSKMPTSELKEKAIITDRYLIYGLKEMVIHAQSGSGLFESMVNVANAGYGEMSIQFDWVVRKVNTGAPLIEVLNETVNRTYSEYFKKVLWQLINTIDTGSDLSSMLQPIIEELDYHQKAQIQNYARELNLWSLVYMIFSAAIPTIGSTMLVILSVFANFGVDETFFIAFAAGSLLIQIVLIFIVKSRRPNVVF